MEFKNLLVTGGCGFIGTNFIYYLLDKVNFKGTVINIDKLTYSGNRENLLPIEKKYSDQYVFVHGDICSKELLKDIFSRYSIDGVCHFAAESHVDRAIRNPEDFIHTNILGTYNLLEAARQKESGFKLFHHVSTDEVYGSLGSTGLFTEDTPYRPNSPYSASKAASDHLVRSYYQTYGLPVTISNCSNNYGPYQFPEKLIPLIILRAVSGEPLPVYGDGKNVRDWLYVEDHCEALWLIMNSGRKGEMYNIGGATEMENIKIVEMICDRLDEKIKRLGIGQRRKLITFVKDRPGHDRRYAIDFTKLRTELSWTPKESFVSGLSKTINWYLDNPQWIEYIKSGHYRQWIEDHYEGV